MVCKHCLQVLNHTGHVFVLEGSCKQFATEDILDEEDVFEIARWLGRKIYEVHDPSVIGATCYNLATIFGSLGKELRWRLTLDKRFNILEARFISFL